MKLTHIHAGLFKLDGGAMFGVVPKKMWNKLNPSDENNMCTWGMHCILIQTGEKYILVDTGMGNKQDDKFKSHFEPHGPYELVNELNKINIAPEQITDVFLTHLHFDHVGGAVKRDEGGHLVATFPNAVYWSNRIHWEWAMNPNPRETASFLKENFVPLLEQNKVKFIEKSGDEIAPGIKTIWLYGHTEAMMGLEINDNGKKYYYLADLIPSSFHIGLPYIMSYDLRPLITLEEKTSILNKMVDENAILLIEHDPTTYAVTLKRDDHGRIVKHESIVL